MNKINIKFPAFAPIDLSNSPSIGITELLLTEIKSNANQPRKMFDSESLEELSASIKKYGIIQPIIVSENQSGGYQIIAGERRWRAATLAGLKKIPSIIQHGDLKNNAAVALIENIQRENLNPIELGEAFFQLQSDYSLSHEQIATMVGKSRATVTNLLRLLNLSHEVRQLLVASKLDMGHARALLTLPKEQQLSYAAIIIEKDLNVRATELLVKAQIKQKKTYISPNNRIKELRTALSYSLSSKVEINVNESGKVKVTIDFTSLEKLEWLIDRLEDGLKN